MLEVGKGAEFVVDVVVGGEGVAGHRRGMEFGGRG